MNFLNSPQLEEFITDNRWDCDKDKRNGNSCLDHFTMAQESSLVSVKHSASRGKRPGKKRNSNDGLQCNLPSSGEENLRGKPVLKLSIPKL